MPGQHSDSPAAPSPCSLPCPYSVLTDLVKNQIEDTARVRGIPRESVINDVLLADQVWPGQHTFPGAAGWEGLAWKWSLPTLLGQSRCTSRLPCSATPWLAACFDILVAAPSLPSAACPPSHQLPPEAKEVAVPHIQVQLTPTPLKPLTQTPNAPTCPYPQPTKQFVDPKDIAALVLHLCGPNSKSFTGACLSIDGKPQGAPVACLH